MSRFTLDLKDYIKANETALVGREEGQKMLANLNLRAISFEEIEKTYEGIDILIPDSIITINKSYFLGLFELRIQALGVNGFKSKYNFVGNELIREKIDQNIIFAIVNPDINTIFE